MSKSTRERILHTLLKQPRATIIDLARAVGINAISVRHHLTSLQVEGLVQAEEERHGVGRPRLVYTLTEQGQERFPTRYFRLTNRLLDRMKETMDSATVQRLFTDMAESVADEHAAEFAALPVEDRLDLLKELLAEEGFSVEWENMADSYRIREISCPYLHIGQTHPEVCTVDQTLISRVLEVPAEKVQCVLHGDSHCTYIVSKKVLKEQTR